jgi:hypothetical protein
VYEPTYEGAVMRDVALGFVTDWPQDSEPDNTMGTVPIFA